MNISFYPDILKKKLEVLFEQFKETF